MKQLLNLFLLSFLVLASCKKENDAVVVHPKPVPGQPSGRIQLNIAESGITGVDSLDLVAELRDAAGNIVWDKKEVRAGKSSQGFTSAPIDIPQGQYRLTSLLVKSGGQLLRVAPILGSTRAGQVAQPLPVSLGVGAAVGTLSPGVLPLGPVDGPQDFGYPAQLFPSNAFEIYVRASVKVGQVAYDSIPAKLEMTSLLENGEELKQTVDLLPGFNKVPVSRKAGQLNLVMKQWNARSEKTLQAGELKDGIQVLMAAERDIKRISMQAEYLEVQGQWYPQSKSYYTYRAGGKLDQVKYFQKKPQSQELQHIFTDRGVYEGSLLARVNRFDQNGQQVGKTWYEYDGNGAMTHVSNQSYDVTIHGAIEHGVENGKQLTEIYYLFDNGATMHYKMSFGGGNKLEESAVTSKGGSEGGTYAYDHYVNPFQQVAFPDLYLSQLSKNNMVAQQRGFSGAIPSSVPYKYEYTYDADGYPLMVIKYYKSYQTNQDLYRTKTIFTY